MSLLDQLSSQVGDRTEAANRRVAAQCLINPALLTEIAQGLESDDAALVGDCAEVMTKVAAERPEWVAPYAEALSELLRHKKTRVRWEAMHALGLVAPLAPQVIAAVLPRLSEMLRSDKSVIVRDCIVIALGSYARVGTGAAEDAYPILKEALTAWEGKQAVLALEGLLNVVEVLPGLADELRSVAEAFLEDRKARVRKAAKALVKVCGGQDG